MCSLWDSVAHCEQKRKWVVLSDSSILISFLGISVIVAERMLSRCLFVEKSEGFVDRDNSEWNCV